jgi:hypothetical protein
MGRVVCAFIYLPINQQEAFALHRATVSRDRTERKLQEEENPTGPVPGSLH